MKISFCITTAGTAVDTLNKSIETIIQECEQKCEYEILVIGGKQNDISFDGVRHIEFLDDPTKGFLPKRKNFLAKEAIYDNIVMMHDYLALQIGWLDGFIKFNIENPDWLACVNRIQNINGKEFRSWCAVFQDAYRTPIDNQKPPLHLGLGRKINPRIKTWGRWQYYSGAYFIVRKRIMLDSPMDETLERHQGEDITTSRQWYQKYGSKIFAWNPYSTIKFLKPKDHAGWESLPEINYDMGLV